MTSCRLVVLLGLAFTAGPATGQVFQKTYWTPIMTHAWAVAPTADGGAVIAGHALVNTGGLGVILAKLDAGGSLVWRKSYSAQGTALCVQQTRDGGYILAGEVPAGGGGVEDALLIRTDADGTPLWSAVYGAPATRERAAAVVETIDGGFAFVGFTGVGIGPLDAYAVRTDSRGNVVWARTYGGAGDHTARSLLATTDGGFLFVGNANTPAAGSSDVLVMKIDAAGAPIWSKTYGGPSQDWAVAVVELGSGYLVAAGTQSFGVGGFDPGLIALDHLGNVLWGNTYGSSVSELPMGMVRTTDGDVVIVGWTDGSVAPSRAFALRTDATGALRWSKFYTGANDVTSFWSVAAAADAGSWLVGMRGANNESVGMLVVKTNDDGAATCRETAAGFIANSMALFVGNGPASQPGPGTRSWGNVGASVPKMDTTTLCFCEGARRTNYGTGWRGTFGVPALVAFERPVLGRTVTLHAGNSLGATTTGLLLLGRQPLDVVTPFDGTLLVQIELGLGVAVGVAGAQVPLTIPNDTTLCGRSLFAQMLELDSGATRGVSFTPGLELQFGM